MSDYTPTTEEVREVYVEVSDGADFPSWRHAAEHKAAGGGGAEFDRWLAEVERAAREDAWDEGFNVGYDAMLVDLVPTSGAPDLRVNPYRKEHSDE